MGNKSGVRGRSESGIQIDFYYEHFPESKKLCGYVLAITKFFDEFSGQWVELRS